MKKSLEKEIKNLEIILAQKPNKPKPKSKIRDYGYGKIDFHKKNIESSIKKIRALAFELASGCKEKSQQMILTELFLLLKNDFLDKLPEIFALVEKIKDKKQEQKIQLSVTALPEEIR